MCIRDRYDCEQSVQDDLVDSGQEEEYNNEEQSKFKSKFANFTYEIPK